MQQESTIGTQKIVSSVPQEREWTFLAYIANDLLDARKKTFAEMCTEGISLNTHIAVQVDSNRGEEGITRYEISEKDDASSHPILLDSFPRSIHVGNAVNIEKFLTWGLDRYPSKKTLFVVWNPLASFGTFGRRAQRKKIAVEDLDVEFIHSIPLDMVILEKVIKIAIKKSKKPNDFKIDVLGCDACLMNMLEVAYQFKDVAHYLVGSQQIETGYGWSYAKVLRDVNLKLDAEELSTRIAMRYAESSQDNITHSSLRLSGVENVKLAVENLAAHLLKILPNHRTQIRSARIATQIYQNADYVDLVHLMGELKKIESLEEHAENVAKAVGRAVVSTVSRGDQVKNSHGVSIWFPPTEASYLEYKAQYVGLKFNGSEENGKESTWTKFLDAYFVGSGV